MAQSSSGQAEQIGLAALLTRDVAKVWPLLDAQRLKESMPQWMAATMALIHRYSQASASLAASHYARTRLDAGVWSAFTAEPADPPAVEHMTASLRWATSDLWGAEPNVDSALVRVDGAAQKLVADTGRSTLLDAVQADREAKGWARIAREGCCAFCAMLASRGAVYRTESTASFEAHDHCSCTVEPLFGASYEMTADARHWEQLWRDSTQGASGKDARNAFRRALAAERR